MKIAIPTIGSIIDESFDPCEVFTIFTIDESINVTDSEILFTPEGCDCKNNIPLTLQQKGVTILVAYKIPEHADGVCEKFGIKPFLGYQGNVRASLECFLRSELKY